MADGGSPNVAGPGVANPLPHPLDGPAVVYTCVCDVGLPRPTYE